MGGVNQTAVNIELKANVALSESGQSQDEGLAPSIREDWVVQIHGVELPVRAQISY